MKVEETQLARWFKNKLKTIMKHNGRKEDESISADDCDKLGVWTPCDLIAREELNNGGGSARGFLGITPSDCHKCYNYMKEHKEYLVDNNLISEKAWNNSGYPLWHSHNF